MTERNGATGKAMTQKGHFIDGRWLEGTGPAMASRDPAGGAEVWRGRAATVEEIDHAVSAARAAFPAWADRTVQERHAVLESFARQLKAHEASLAETISREVGKPLWESRAEVASMIAKVPITLDAYRQRCATSEVAVGDATGATRFRPHGVVAVFGPFNVPGHIPNGHIVPALLAGNTAVFKPSEAAPGVAQKTVELWENAGLPAGVLNLVQGGRETGQALAAHGGIDGIFFTGGTQGGLALRRLLADRPQRILTLEMGGNNPLVVLNVADFDAAAFATVQSAFLTAGQRCTCARRLVVPRGAAGDAFLDRLIAMIGRIIVAPYNAEPAPFMGPVISTQAAERLLAAQADLLKRGADGVVPMRRIGDTGALLSPGLIDVTGVKDRKDAEIFGPLLQLIRVADFDEAIDEANRTAFGLAAGLLCDRRELYDQFYRRVRAGLINWNRQLTNASSKMPFGGVGLSGNHRPAGYFSVDYCAYPVASIEAERITLPDNLGPGMS
jgi:succinylglutamic semialdehyde dehydrogenase